MFIRRWLEKNAAMRRGADEILDIRWREGTTEDVALPIGELLLEDLVATELVPPDSGGDVAQG